MARAWAVLFCWVAAGGLAAAPASAEVLPGRPDESLQQAYPISPNTVYDGAFDNSNYDDVDYLAFHVTQANQTLQFGLANTTQTCSDPNDAGCPVYATLMDANDQQVGGDASGAGTVATAGDAEVFQWTFATPGTYYLLLESDGDLAPGNPSYAVDFGPAGGVGGGSSTTSHTPLLRSFKVRPRQQGSSVRASVLLGQSAARLNLALVVGHRVVARLTRRRLAAGLHRLMIRLPRADRGHRVSAVVKLVVVGSSGGRATASLGVVLSATASP